MHCGIYKAACSLSHVPIVALEYLICVLSGCTWGQGGETRQKPKDGKGSIKEGDWKNLAENTPEQRWKGEHWVHTHGVGGGGGRKMGKEWGGQESQP